MSLKQRKLAFMEETIKEKKGIVLKTFGMSLILLASLNMAFHWRGGFSLPVFYPLIMGTGVALFIFGVLRGK